MGKEKHVLLLLASAATGTTIQKSLGCIEYYGWRTEGISAIFSTVSYIKGYSVNAIFNQYDLPTYATYAQKDCPFCKKGIKLDAIVNGYGYSKL